MPKATACDSLADEKGPPELSTGVGGGATVKFRASPLPHLGANSQLGASKGQPEAQLGSPCEGRAGLGAEGGGCVFGWDSARD